MIASLVEDFSTVCLVICCSIESPVPARHTCRDWKLTSFCTRICLSEGSTQIQHIGRRQDIVCAEDATATAIRFRIGFRSENLETEKRVGS